MFVFIIEGAVFFTINRESGKLIAPFQKSQNFQKNAEFSKFAKMFENQLGLVRGRAEHRDSEFFVETIPKCASFS